MFFISRFVLYIYQNIGYLYELLKKYLKYVFDIQVFLLFLLFLVNIVYFYDLIVQFLREVYEELEMEEEFVVSYRFYYMERIVLFMSFLKVGLGRKVDSLYYII